MPPPLPPPPPPPPPPPSTLPQLQTTPDFAPNDLLKEMGFDISPTTTTRTSSNSTVSPTSLTTTMDEKKYDLAYMCVLNRKVHDTYRNLKGTVMCECNSQASLRVTESPSNPGRPFFWLPKQRWMSILSVGRCRVHQEKRRTTKTLQRIWQVLKITQEKKFHFFFCK